MKKKLISIILVIIVGFCIYIILNEITSGEVQQDEKYIKMNEIYTKNSFIGLSEEVVVEQLGEPIKIYTYSDKVYMYGAGYTYEGLIFGHHSFWTEKHNYVLYVTFDETDKVKTTSLKERP